MSSTSPIVLKPGQSVIMDGVGQSVIIDGVEMTREEIKENRIDSYFYRKRADREMQKE